MLDEIHVKPQLSFKNCTLNGCDEDNNLATSIRCFMISNLRSNYKEVVKLFQSKKLDADKLLTFLKSVLRCLVQAGFKFVTVTTDGNRTNRRLYFFYCVNAITYLIFWFTLKIHLATHKSCLYSLMQSIFGKDFVIIRLI